MEEQIEIFEVLLTRSKSFNYEN